VSRRLPTKDDLLAVFASSGDRALHAREVFAKLDLPESSYLGVLRILDDMVYDAVLAPRPGQRFMLAKETARGRGQLLTGVLSVNARGFGFVAASDGEGDVFVPGENLGGGMQGDTVEVRVVSKSSRGREGAVERIVARKTVRVAGVLRRRGKSAWLEPDDTRVRGPIELARGIDQEGPAGNSGNDGDAAVVRITRYPELPDENPQGVIEAVLGKPGELNVEVQKLLIVGGARELHDDDAVAEAEAYGVTVPTSMLEGRVDLTDVPLPTIDPEDARDHDDAVWVERRDDGGYRAWIAIADVSSYVRPDTALDREALARGASIYLPDRALPMLPRALSSNLCSLLPDVIRLCLCAIVDLDAGGRVRKTELVRGYMKSRAKLTYGGVARALGLSALPPRDPAAEAMVDDLRVAFELSRKLRDRRRKRGALELEVPEPRVTMNDRGLPETITRRGQDPGVKRAYELIEELMILANETVATWLIEKGAPAVFRVHDPPDEQKLARLAAMCDVLGVPFELDDARDPKALAALVNVFNEHAMAGVLNNLLLRSMKQAIYDVENRGHFGLASDAYLHFTSPIRRYPDLMVHRQVHRLVEHARVDKSDEARQKLAESAIACSQAERRIMEIERQVLDLYRVFVMKDRIGDMLEGVVSAIVSGGVFVTLDDPFVDVLVRFEDLGPGGYEADEDALRAVALRSGDTVQLGDRLTVEIVEAALLRRVVYARRLVGESSHDGARLGPRRGAKGRSEPFRVRREKGAVRGSATARPERRGGKPAKPEPPARPGKRKGKGPKKKRR
jgi:ribonuclease R